MNQIILEAKGICKSFEGSEVLRDISFQVEKGEFVAVMGQSGCGKSTLLYNLSDMDSPTGGEVVFEGQRLTDLPEKEMEKIRLTRMGFIFQRANFLKNLSIEDNIIFPAFQAGEKSRQKIVKEA